MGVLETDWDVIVVGGGSAGAVLAARLSEQATRRVLLLEAGPDYRSADQPPAMRSLNSLQINLQPAHKARYLWPALTARRTEAQDATPFQRGRGVGGSSAINGQIAIRGVADAFDTWAELGCRGWSFREVLPAFMRLERDLDFGHESHHGTDGPIPVRRLPKADWGPIDRALHEAALAEGEPELADLNAPAGLGASVYPLNHDGTSRVSTNDAYLEPARDRPNLAIVGDALVDRVCFDGMRATGVRVWVAGAWHEVRGRSVILSAGAVHSPAILMRSGVGDPAALAPHGLAVHHALPAVGRHLIDHPLVSIRAHIRPAHRLQDPQARHQNAVVKYSSGLATPSDMIILAISHTWSGAGEGSLATGALAVSLYEAYSRGEVRLASPDPLVDPVPEERMLSDERDLVRLRLGVRRMLHFAAHPAMQAVADYTGTRDALPLDALRQLSDADVDAWCLAEAVEAKHISGTCRMGPAARGDSVVDPADCRVHGLAGLHVADASVMPADCRANTHLTTVMIAEHLAPALQRTLPAG